MKSNGGKTYSFFDKPAMLRKSVPFPLLVISGSTIFWILVIWISYYSYLYISLYNQIYDETDLKIPCDKIQPGDSSRNLKRVLNYPMGEAVPYLNSFESEAKSVMPSEHLLPFIVTAVTSSQFYQVQSLIRHINEVLSSAKDLNFIIYDVGLTAEESTLLKNQCECIFRKFWFDPYPLHVESYNFAWRPLIIKDILKETGSVIYIEPTTRFKSVKSLEMFRNRGTREFYLWDTPTYISVIGYTYPKMFDFFQENRCPFVDSGMISTEIMVFYKTNSTWNTLVKPWIACALNKDCISPDGARADSCFHMRHPRTTGCHRFDQSALSIIANRGHQLTLDRNKYIPQRVTYYDNTGESYFEDQPRPLRFYFVCFVITIILIFAFKRRRRC